MNLRPFLPALAVTSALAATTAAYRLAPHAALSSPPRPDADRIQNDLPDETYFIRSVARMLVAREVVAGRTTVPEAAAIYRWLDTLPPRTRGAWVDQVEAAAGLSHGGEYTEAELLGVRVVAEVRTLARFGPDLPLGSVDRVWEEFLTAQVCGDFAPLPTVSAERCSQLLEKARAEAQRMVAGRPTSPGMQLGDVRR